jgi:HJR/Mrr/RecB family endonuclease
MKTAVFWVVLSFLWEKSADVSEVPAASIITTLMMEAESSSETLVNFYQTTRRYKAIFERNLDNNHIIRFLSTITAKDRSGMMCLSFEMARTIVNATT